MRKVELRDVVGSGRAVLHMRPEVFAVRGFGRVVRCLATRVRPVASRIDMKMEVAPADNMLRCRDSLSAGRVSLLRQSTVQCRFIAAGAPKLRRAVVLYISRPLNQGGARLRAIVCCPIPRRTDMATDLACMPRDPFPRISIEVHPFSEDVIRLATAQIYALHGVLVTRQQVLGERMMPMMPLPGQSHTGH